MLCQFEMWHQYAVTEYCGAGAGAKRQNDLQSSPFYDSKTLNLGVVEQSNRLAETLR